MNASIDVIRIEISESFSWKATCLCPLKGVDRILIDDRQLRPVAHTKKSHKLNKLHVI